MKLLQNISPSGHLLFQSRNDFSILPHLFVLAAPTVSATLHWSDLVTGPTHRDLFSCPQLLQAERNLLKLVSTTEKIRNKNFELSEYLWFGLV